MEPPQKKPRKLVPVSPARGRGKNCLQKKGPAAKKEEDGANLCSTIPVCAWCFCKLKKTNGEYGVATATAVGDAAAAELKHRFGRSRLCTEHSALLQQYVGRCDQGIEAFPQLRSLVIASASTRSTSNAEIVVRSNELRLGANTLNVPTIEMDGSNVYFPLSHIKRTRNPHWIGDKRWLRLKDLTFDQPPSKQIIICRKTFLLPFGAPQPYPKCTVLASELKIVEDLFAGGSELKCAYKLYQYLTSCTSNLEHGSDSEFLAAFMLRFLAEECISVWPARMGYVTQMAFEKCWTTSWGPVAALNAIHSDKDDKQLICLSRQPPLRVAGSLPKAGDYNIHLAKLKETQRRQATMATIILFSTALGRDLLALLRSFGPFRRAAGIAMTLSFLLCEVRKNADTGSNRFRDAFDADGRRQFDEAMRKQFPRLLPKIISLRHRGEAWVTYAEYVCQIS